MERTSRRRFLWGSLALAGSGLLVGCGLPRSPLQASAGIPRIGVVNGASAGFYVPLLAAFRQRLEEHGYEEGRTIAIGERYLDGQSERAPQVVNELLQQGVVAIVSGDPVAVQAAQRATSTIPIIMAGVGTDPTSLGREGSRARPVDNITGLSLATPGLSGRRLEVLHEAVPDAGRIGVLVDDTTGHEAVRVLERQMREAGQSLGVEVRSIHVQGSHDLEPAILGTRRDGTGAVWVPATPLTASYIDQLLDLVLQHRVPAIFSLSEIARGGGLMALGIDRGDLYRRAADYVDKVLNGARPADLPIDQPTGFELVVNLQTAQALGLTIPQSILQRASELIR
jgi:putative ABC transport system substrate-binding protein